MKTLTTLSLMSVGLLTGWHLPHRDDSKSSSIADQTISQRQRHPNRRKVESFFNEEDRRSYRAQHARSANEWLQNRPNFYNFNSDDIQLLADLGLETSLRELITHPSAPYNLCQELAIKWLRQDPAGVVHFLRNIKNYRADRILASVLPEAFMSHPDLVKDTIRSMPKNWQRYHLESLANATASKRDPNAPPPPPPEPTEDPFASDPEEEQYWTSIDFGLEFLDLIDDPVLREKALAHRIAKEEENNPEKVSEEPSEPALVNFADYDGNDWNQQNAFYEKWKESPEETLAEIIESGNFNSRVEAMNSLIGDFSMNEENWPEELQKIETWMEQLKVIPQYLPSNFHTGTFLQGQVPADWITQQPLALQRAWTPTFIETWAERDPEEALTWGLTRPAETMSEQGIQRSVIAWAHSEPLAATQFVETLPQGELRESAISNAAAAWFIVDPPGAQSWLEGLPDSPGKSRALERISE